MLIHWKTALMLVSPSVGKIKTMKRRRVNVLTIIDRFSADLVQCISKRAVQLTATGNKGVNKRSKSEGRIKATVLGKNDSNHLTLK
jgi:hypothetical protein